MGKLNSKLVALFKLLSIRDQASSLGFFIGGYNRGRAQSSLMAFAGRVDLLAREVHSSDHASIKAKVSRLRTECEQVVSPAMIPAGNPHFLEDAMVLLSMARSLEQYCFGPEF